MKLLQKHLCTISELYTQTESQGILKAIRRFQILIQIILYRHRY